MDTTSYSLQGVVSPSESGLEFLRLEVASSERLPIAVVWYRAPNLLGERGVRIDLQKQAFLDDFVVEDGSLNDEAIAIARFLSTPESEAQKLVPEASTSASVY